MVRRLILALAGLLISPDIASAEMQHIGPVSVEFYASSESRAYGVLIVAPRDISCATVRYRIDGAMRQVVSRPVGAGGLIVVRLGSGFARGDQRLSVMPLGCGAAPTMVRRVIFGKAAPDHSWRVRPISGSTDVEGHALRQGQS